MGNSTRRGEDLQVVSTFRRQQWVVLQKMGGYQIWENSISKVRAHAYPMQAEPTIAQLQNYQLRSNNNKDIVSVYNVDYQRNQNLCSKHARAVVLIEPVLVRLSDITVLSQQESLSVLRASFNGFNVLGSFFGPVQPYQDMICFNEQGQPKVWLNSNLVKNHAEEERQPLGKEHLKEKNEIWVGKILDMVQNKTIGGRIPDRLKEKFRERSPKNYFSALNLLEEYAAEQKIKILDIVPSIGEKISHASSVLDRRDKSQQQRPMQRNPSTRSHLLPQSSLMRRNLSGDIGPIFSSSSPMRREIFPSNQAIPARPQLFPQPRRIPVPPGQIFQRSSFPIKNSPPRIDYHPVRPLIIAEHKEIQRPQAIIPQQQHVHQLNQKFPPEINQLKKSDENSVNAEEQQNNGHNLQAAENQGDMIEVEEGQNDRQIQQKEQFLQQNLQEDNGQRSVPNPQPEKDNSQKDSENIPQEEEIEYLKLYETDENEQKKQMAFNDSKSRQAQPRMINQNMPKAAEVRGIPQEANYQDIEEYIRKKYRVDEDRELADEFNANLKPSYDYSYYTSQQNSDGDVRNMVEYVESKYFQVRGSHPQDSILDLKSMERSLDLKYNELRNGQAEEKLVRGSKPIVEESEVRNFQLPHFNQNFSISSLSQTGGAEERVYGQSLTLTNSIREKHQKTEPEVEQKLQTFEKDRVVKKYERSPQIKNQLQAIDQKFKKYVKQATKISITTFARKESGEEASSRPDKDHVYMHQRLGEHDYVQSQYDEKAEARPKDYPQKPLTYEKLRQFIWN